MDTNSHTMEGGYLEGNSHANGGIKIKTPEGQIEAEGGETIINKRSMESQDILICEGTPKEIASKVNEYGGGVEFAEGGNCKTVSMAEDRTQVESNMPKEYTTTFDNGGALQVEITNPNTKEKTYTITSLYDSELSWQSSYKGIEKYIKEEGKQFDCQKDDTMAVCLRKLGLRMVANIEIPIYETDFDIHEDQTASRGTNLRSTDKDKRPSPSISATIFPVGHTMEGNDGNMWQINEDSRGIHRWGRVKAEDGLDITMDNEDISRLEKLKKEGKLKRYLDVRGNGKKVFETIIPNKSEKGMYKRYESTSQSSLGTLQNEYLDENDVLNWLKKTSPKYAKSTTIKGGLGKTYICEKEGRIEVYSGSDVRSAEVMEGDEFVVTEDLSKIYYLGKLKIKGTFKVTAGLSGKDVSKISYGNLDEVIYLLRKENIGGNSDFFAQFKDHRYSNGGGVGKENADNVLLEMFESINNFEEKWLWYLKNDNLIVEFTLHYGWVDEEYYVGPEERMGEFLKVLDYRYVALEDEDSNVVMVSKEKEKEIIKELDNIYKEHFENKDKDIEIDNVIYGERKYIYDGPIILENSKEIPEYEKGNTIKDEMTFNNSIGNAITRLTNYIGTHENKIVINKSTYTIDKVTPNFIRVSGGQGATYNIVPYFPKNALNTPSILLTPRFYYSLSRGSVKHTFAIFEDGSLFDIAEEGIDVNINEPKMNSFKSTLTINNNYKGKRPFEIWDAWNEDQRKHFLKDHDIKNLDNSKIKEYTFDELPLSVKIAVRFHKNSGQYANGGIIGKRIKLIKMNDDPYPVEPGTMGTVKFIDDNGQIHVNWDNGRTLAIIPRVDEYQIM